MMFHKLGLMNKNQKGITLMEVMLVFAMTSIIAGGITMTFYQVVTGSMRTNNHMIAVAQAQNAGYWVGRDAQMAQNVNLGVSSGFPLILTWTDWGGTQSVVTYTIAGGELRREETGSGTTESVVANFIDSAPTKTKCEVGGTFTLSDVGDAFRITGGAVADSGTITVLTGSITVITAGGATYNAGTGAWTTPAGGGTITVTASGFSTTGIWISTVAKATAAITADADGDAAVTGHGIIFTVTVSVGSSSEQQSETRVYKIVPRTA